MALDALPGGSLCLLAGAPPAPCQSTSSPTTVEPGHPGGVGGKGPERGPAGTWVVAGPPPPLPDGLRPLGLCHPGLPEVPQGCRAPEVADKAGLCPFKELWFEESRCPEVGGVGGEGPLGS